MLVFLILLELILILIFSLYILSIIFELIYKVSFVPSRKELVKKLFQEYSFEKEKIFIDFGSGIGDVVFEAAKNGLIAYGYEINPSLYLISLIRRKFKKINNAYFCRQDFKKADIANASYVYLYLLPETMKKIEEYLFQTLPQKSKIISLAFKFHERNYQEVLFNKFYIYKV